MLISPKTSSTTLACASLACLLLLAACKTETIVPQPEEPEQPEQSLQSIRWSVCSAETRALVDDNILQTSCIPVESGNYHSIGVWGQYTINENGQQTTNTEFSATPLTFSRKPTDTNPYNDWNYPGDTRYWRMDARYDFRACYPQKRMTELMTQMDATIIQGAVNTSVLQEDLLVAAAQVSTAITTPRGPVPLLMKHIFAALKFKIMPKEGYTPPTQERVTGCWLQNTGNTTDQFSPSGYLVHSGNADPKITWYAYESSAQPMYKWEHAGLSFATEALMYSANGTTAGQEYTTNDGWLLVVPQPVKERTLQFCYTLKSTGSEVFRANIPAITYEYGKRYTYILYISGAGVEVKLKISEWNKMDSTYDIII